MGSRSATHILSLRSLAAETIDHVLPWVDRLATPRLWPVAIVATDTRRVQRLAHVSDVLDIQPIDEITAKVILGLDVLINVGTLAASRVTPNGLQAGESDAGYPVLNYPPTGDGQPPVIGEPGRVFPTRHAVLCGINISWGVGKDEHYVPSHPLISATRWAASQAPIVFAAGNWYHGMQAETMSAWAESAWVISVGATDDQEGGKLLEKSSAGVKDDPRSGPTVVAYGASVYDESRRGTSYAAPRVLRALVQLAAWTLTLRHFASRTRGGIVEGIPVVGRGLIDEGIPAEAGQRVLEIPALPAAGVDADALASVLRLATSLGIDVELWPTPHALRHMLLASAQPLEGLGPHEQGRGFISDLTTSSYLEAFSGADLLAAFAHPTSAWYAALREAEGIRLSVREDLSVLADVWRASARPWSKELTDDLW